MPAVARRSFALPLLAAVVFLPTTHAATEAFGAGHLAPNLTDHLERPLRYHPDGGDFVIENGDGVFNRPLYGGNTAFRVDAGDRPEFVLYLPGRGGNLRLGLRAGATTKWLHDAARIVARYRPGQMLYEIQDPLLGDGATLQLAAIAYAETEGLIVRAALVGQNAQRPVELIWAYGGVNGQRGKRDGDIGTENVPISEWFQLRPEFCAGNAIAIGGEGFTLSAKPATIAGVVPREAKLSVADAAAWNDPATLFAPAPAGAAAPKHPVLVGRAALSVGEEVYLSLQRLAASADRTTEDLATYREVTASRTEAGSPSAPGAPQLAPVFARGELPARFRAAERHFRELRQRVSVETPDPFFDAAVGALNVAADAAWDAPQQAIMHGAIAWRTKLLGWRGPYSLDALGWHERARSHFRYWAGRQNTSPIPAKLPPADENANLARNETGLHSNGDLSNSHYDMNLVYMDALFRHLQWTGDLAFAREMWPTIERHLAWERRLFRREFGPEKLPLYEAYAAIWASDELQYHGGGAAHATAYNYFHHAQAARLARLIGEDPTPFEREAELIARGMRELLWRPGRGGLAEFKDLLGAQRTHPHAGLWTFYHAMDAQLPTTREAWQLTQQVETELPHLPVRGPGVPAGLSVPGTTTWMPYRWSINNVVMSEIAHTALGFWQAGRPREAWTMTKGALLAAMYMGISPGNVGSMSYLDVYRRESQRDFADGSGVLSRTVVEGLFGIEPDLLAGELRVTPGFPAEWTHANLRHPNVSLRFTRDGDTDHYVITQRFGQQLRLRMKLVAPRDRVASFAINGDSASWQVVEDSVGEPQIVLTSPAGGRHEILITWGGERIAANEQPTPDDFTPRAQGQMRWLQPPAPAAPLPPTLLPTFAMPADARFETVDLTKVFNDRVTQIFRDEYRAPRSPFVSLAIPKQGIGGWAGGVNDTAEIDDSGLRAVAARQGGRLVLPNGVPLATPGESDARNIAFTSLWDNYPDDVTLPLSGRARGVVLLMAGSTNHMQSRFENGEIVVTYADGSTQRLALENPTTWWPIEQDFFIDDFQFQVAGPLPTRVDLKTGAIRELDATAFKGRGRTVPGGAATVLALPLDPTKPLQSLTVRTLANEVVVGLMAATLVR